MPGTLRASKTLSPRCGCGRKGLLCLEAAVELLIGNRSWLFREDFLEIAVEFGWEVFSGQPMAAVLRAAGHRGLRGAVRGER